MTQNCRNCTIAAISSFKSRKIMSKKITRLVFSGGGAKGAVYPGAYAALMAVGMSTEDFQTR